MTGKIPPTEANVAAALSYCSPDVDRATWVHLLAAVKNALGDGGYSIAREWSEGGDSFDAIDFKDTWRSIRADGKVTVGTLFYQAKQNGWQFDGETHQETEAERLERERKQKARAERHAREKVRKERQAARKAAALWKGASPARADDPYLVRKGIRPVPTLREISAAQAAEILAYPPKRHGVPLAGRLLVAPVKIDGKLTTAELIDGEGRKAAIAGGPKSGGFWAAQALPKGDGAGLVLAVGEGAVTVLSCREAAGCAAVAALSAGSLPKVATALRQRYPAARLLILGDIGRGLKYAEQAARATGAALAVPDFTGLAAGAKDTDFNDLHRLAGLDAVRGRIEAALTGGPEAGNPEPVESEVEPPIENQDETRRERGAPAADGAGGPQNGAEQSRPLIRVIGGTLPDQVEQAEAALIASDAEVYQRSGEIVRPVLLVLTIEEEGISIPTGTMNLHTPDEHWLGKAMTRAARFEKFDRRSHRWERIDCPPKVAKTYLSSPGEWRVPHIVGISECPTLRRDGTLILDRGYDPRSGIYVSYQGKEVRVSENPTRQDALDALQTLKFPFAEFPFAEDSDRSVALAAVLTGVVRRSLPTAPLFAFDAPKAGSGKGLLADTVAMVVTGRTAAMVSQGKDDAEDEKRLGAVLMRSTPVICIDNIERPVNGDFLCSMLTHTMVMARVLGASRVVDLPTSSLVLATGNNLQFIGDLTRRVLLCRVDPECERPDAREFAVNLREWVPANRHKLIGAVLTLLRAYHLAGRPKQDIPPYGSFEGWSDLVRSALVWLGEPDPCRTRERLETNDPVAASLSAVLVLWHRAFKDQIKTAAEVVNDCQQEAHADLKHALLEVAAGLRTPDAIDAKRLGKWLKKYDRRIETGRRIEKAGVNSDTKIAYWRVVTVPGNTGFTGSAPNPSEKSVSDNDDNKTIGVGTTPRNPRNPRPEIMEGGL